MGVKLLSASAGSVEIVAPATASNFTATMPAGSGTVVLDSATQTLTNKTIQGGAITSGTAVASTSGTSIDFTGIPSWVKQITVVINAVSTNGSSLPLIQLGTSAGVTVTGYTSLADSSYGAGAIQTAGFGIERVGGAAISRIGTGVLTNISGNNWVFSYNGVQAGSAIAFGSGAVSLAAVLDRVRITTVGGTDTFDAGSINILYE